MTSQRTPSAIDALANDFLSRDMQMHPESCTAYGTNEADLGTFSDYSPEGIAADRELLGKTLAALEKLEPMDDVDKVTKASMLERLGLQAELIDAGEETGTLRVIASPVQGISEIFDLMPTETAEDWDNIARRLAAVPQALSQYRESLLARRASGPVFQALQANECAKQADRIAGDNSPLSLLIKDHPELEKQAASARAAYGELASFLREEVLPHATTVDGVGAERYGLHSREFLGTSIDMDETYEWGQDQLRQIITEQEAIAAELYGPGTSVREAMDRLDADPERRIEGVENFRLWMQQTADCALEEMKKHFDIPERMARIECCIAPGGTGAVYYTNPTDDFSRPGRMWWAVPEGVTSFSTWQERTTVHHEGVPGHHLQLGYATYLADTLNDWRRRNFVSGHGEGWALYAEQLMVELGLVTDPADRLGVLDAQRLRASRVVVDLGVHLGKDAGEWGDGAWDRDAAWRFLRTNLAGDDSFLSFELNRYLGWPGQAPAYKIGQRVWEELRAEAKAKQGDAFSLKDWHMKALSVGSVGLDTLREALA